MTNFADALGSLVGDDPTEKIAGIKGLVIENLHAVDARVKVEVTDHFNHTFVPDMVLSWPGTSERRHIFLRTSYDVADLVRDVDMLAAEKPILMPLTRVTEFSERSLSNPDLAAQLESLSVATGTLITDPYGLEVLGVSTEEQPVVSLFSHAVLQGGRGLLSSERAGRVSDAVGAGFAGAQQADFESTNTAVEATELLLDSHRASQMTRLLHAVWVGSGASGAGFPTAAGVTAVLDAEALRFVLELDIADDEFWLRLGRGITTGRLCELGEAPANANLQRLLAGNAHRLFAKACRVSAPASGVIAPQWAVVGSTLTLDTPSARVQFAARSVADLPSRSDESARVTVTDLKGRAARAEVEIEEIKLSNGQSTLSYASEGGLDVSQDSTLGDVERVLTGSSVVSAVAKVGGGSRSLRCTFRTGTGTGNSSAKFYVAELANVAVPLLVGLAEAEQAAIREVVSAPTYEEAEINPEEVADDSPDDREQ